MKILLKIMFVWIIPSLLFWIVLTSGLNCCLYGNAVKDSAWLNTCRLEIYVNNDGKLTDEQKQLRIEACKNERKLLDAPEGCEGTNP